MTTENKSIVTAIEKLVKYVEIVRDQNPGYDPDPSTLVYVTFRCLLNLEEAWNDREAAAPIREVTLYELFTELGAEMRQVTEVLKPRMAKLEESNAALMQRSTTLIRALYPFAHYMRKLRYRSPQIAEEYPVTRNDLGEPFTLKPFADAMRVFEQIATYDLDPHTDIIDFFGDSKHLVNKIEDLQEKYDSLLKKFELIVEKAIPFIDAVNAITDVYLDASSCNFVQLPDDHDMLPEFKPRLTMKNFRDLAEAVATIRKR